MDGFSSSFFSRGVGIIGDQKCVNRTVLLGCGGLMAGVLTLLSLSLKTFGLLAAYEAIYGVCSGELIYS